MRSRYFFALSYESEERGMTAAARKLVGIAEERTDEDADVTLSHFLKKARDVEAALSANVKNLRRLKGYAHLVGAVEMHCDQLLEYLRLCVTGEHFPFAVPDIPIDLNQYLAGDDFTGEAQPQLGDPLNFLLPGKYIRVLAVDSFPESSFAGILRAMDALPFSFRFSQQAQILDEQEAAKQHDANKSKWRFKGTGGLKGRIKSAAADLDGTALELAADALQAKSAAEHGREVNCRYAGKIILMGENLNALRDAARHIARALRHCGFGSRLETMNAVAAWLGSMPGQQYKDTRHFTVTTANLTHMMPLSQPWCGREFNPSAYFPPKSPPLLYCLTAGATPYRFHSHVDDVGHTLMVGPNGSGKTAAVGLAMAQGLRYGGAQIFGFDKKRALETLTTCIGGSYVDLSPGSETRLCPLADLSTQADRDWAERWISFLVGLNNVTVTPLLSTDIRKAVQLLAESRGGRSINDLRMACSSRSLKEALDFYRNSILDGEQDALRLSRFTVFEMDQLYNLDQRIMNGTLFYVFARIRKRLRSDVPTFMFVDEFRAALSHPLAADAFRDYLFEGRKLNLAVWVVVQELTETLASPLKGAVLEQCFTKICLANPQALLEGRANYEALGCNNADIATIGSATPKSEYYVMQPDGNRLISLELGPVMLALLASSDRDRPRFKALVERLGREEAVAAWLRLRGLAEWAERYEFLAGIGPEVTAKEAVAQYA
jgi:type IV secretion/conjugal transfer VirB4 family ATPase